MAWKILVVEDHPDARELLVFQLQRFGYKVIEATDGYEAVEKALAERPDLIIMDLGLPGMNGIEATVNIKQHDETANVPVIAYTAWVSQLYKEAALKAGITVYLVKPVSPQLLRDVIEKLCPFSAA